MQTRTDEKRRAYLAYGHGDMVAGQIVDADVRQYMRETGASYSNALAARMQEFKQPTAEPRPRPTTAQRYSAGNELNQLARDLMRWKGIGYSDALRQSVLANPALGEDYTGRPIRSGGFNMVYGVASAMQKLGNIIQGVPKRVDGALDADAVLGVLELFADLNREAGQEGLTALARRAVVNVPGQVDQLMPTAMEETRRRYRDLSRMAESGEANVEALRILFPQFFKD